MKRAWLEWANRPKREQMTDFRFEMIRDFLLAKNFNLVEPRKDPQVFARDDIRIEVSRRNGEWRISGPGGPDKGFGLDTLRTALERSGVR